MLRVLLATAGGWRRDANLQALLATADPDFAALEKIKGSCAGFMIDCQPPPSPRQCDAHVRLST